MHARLNRYIMDMTLNIMLITQWNVQIWYVLLQGKHRRDHLQDRHKINNYVFYNSDSASYTHLQPIAVHCAQYSTDG